MKCAIDFAGKFLSKFEPNGEYNQSTRAIQSACHTGAEFIPVFQKDPKWFDIITFKGYLELLADYERYCEKHENYYAQYKMIFRED
jgi:hypothetical protein